MKQNKKTDVMIKIITFLSYKKQDKKYFSYEYDIYPIISEMGKNINRVGPTASQRIKRKKV